MKTLAKSKKNFSDEEKNFMQHWLANPANRVGSKLAMSRALANRMRDQRISPVGVVRSIESVRKYVSDMVRPVPTVRLSSPATINEAGYEIISALKGSMNKEYDDVDINNNNDDDDDDDDNTEYDENNNSKYSHIPMARPAAGPCRHKLFMRMIDFVHDMARQEVQLEMHMHGGGNGSKSKGKGKGKCNVNGNGNGNGNGNSNSNGNGNANSNGDGGANSNGDRDSNSEDEGDGEGEGEGEGEGVKTMG